MHTKSLGNVFIRRARLALKRSKFVFGAIVLGSAVFLASCSTTHQSAPIATSGTGLIKGNGTVDVLYAGSLTQIMESEISTKFNSATGFTFSGFPGGSTALANQMTGGIHIADIFISAAPSVDTTLMTAKGAGKISWYVTFAQAPLVLAYNPSSKFASQLKTKPWQDVIDEPGFLLGRTDPKLDPKGLLTTQALNTAATLYHSPALADIANSSTGVFPEETLIGRLSAGQLDAGFFYSNEAKADGLPTLPLTGINLGAAFTITIPLNTKNVSGAEAFVEFLLLPSTQKLLSQDGLQVDAKPKLTGTGAPTNLVKLFAN
ncbi:MAG: solute-binding protein [Acidimicrobiales bacterium]|nr:solute-binding protein [Acidimicrobiales bacterium]